MNERKRLSRTGSSTRFIGHSTSSRTPRVSRNDNGESKVDIILVRLVLQFAHAYVYKIRISPWQAEPLIRRRILRGLNYNGTLTTAIVTTAHNNAIAPQSRERPIMRAASTRTYILCPREHERERERERGREKERGGRYSRIISISSYNSPRVKSHESQIAWN